MENKRTQHTDGIAMSLSSATGGAVLGSSLGLTGSIVGCILGAIIGAVGAYMRHERLATRKHQQSSHL